MDPKSNDLPRGQELSDLIGDLLVEAYPPMLRHRNRMMERGEDQRFLEEELWLMEHEYEEGER